MRKTVAKRLRKECEGFPRMEQQMNVPIYEKVNTPMNVAKYHWVRPIIKVVQVIRKVFDEKGRKELTYIWMPVNHYRNAKRLYKKHKANTVQAVADKATLNESTGKYKFI